VRQIAKAVGTSERQLFRWLNELQGAGLLTRVKSGRRNSYVLSADAPLREGLPGHWTLSEFLALVARQSEADDDGSTAVEGHAKNFSFPRLRDRARTHSVGEDG
jgi:hypothetical protein